MDLRQVQAELERRGKRKRAPGSILLPTPLYGGAIAARFRVLPPEEIAKMGDAFGEDTPADDPDANALAAAEFVSDACRHLESRNAATGKWEPLTVNGARVGFDQSLAEVLGLEIEEDSAAAVVKAAWTTEDDDGEAQFNAVALTGYALRLLGWMQDTSRPVEDAIVGEAHGGPTSSALVEPPQSESIPASSSPAVEG